MNRLSTNFKNILIEQKENTLIVRLNTEGKINQFSSDVLAELQNLMREIEPDSIVRAIIFTGRDKALAAGANIKQMSTLTQDEGFKLAELGQETFNLIENSPKLTISANNGVAVGGGCELGLACDFRIAVEGGKYGQPEVNLGLIPGWGGSRRLARFIGQTKAIEMILTGKLITAEEACQIGLINKVVSYNELIDASLEMANEVLSKPAHAIAFAKQAFQAGYKMSDRDAELLERDLFGKCFSFEDCKEGMNAFLEKRQPNFVGK